MPWTDFAITKLVTIYETGLTIRDNINKPESKFQLPIKSQLTSPSPSPKSKPKRIEEFGLWAVSKIL